MKNFFREKLVFFLGEFFQFYFTKFVFLIIFGFLVYSHYLYLVISGFSDFLDKSFIFLSIKNFFREKFGVFSGCFFNI